MMQSTNNRLVSTIIPVRNRPDLLREAVASVFAQTHRPIEILIVDDGSSDNACSFASQLKAARFWEGKASRASSCWSFHTSLAVVLHEKQCAVYVYTR